jgi:hypothetical protein
MMRAAIINDLPSSYGNIDHGDIWNLCSRFNFDTLFLDLRQLQHMDKLHEDDPGRWRYNAKGTLDYVRQKGKKVGTVLVPTDWDPDLDGELEAITMANFINDVGYRDLPLMAVFDDERHDPDDRIILPMLKKWRALKATRKTIWSP